jgi:hypothetical protein
MSMSHYSSAYINKSLKTIETRGSTFLMRAIYCISLLKGEFDEHPYKTYTNLIIV